jgi:hypothetical protein
MDQSEVLRFEQQQQITRLSQAIREGAKLRPQCKKFVFAHGKSCAIGAWLEGLGYPYKEGAHLSYLLALPPSIEDAFASADSAYRQKYRLWIWQDNDQGRSRESIADRLESIGL